MESEEFAPVASIRNYIYNLMKIRAYNHRNVVIMTIKMRTSTQNIFRDNRDRLAKGLQNVRLSEKGLYCGKLSNIYNSAYTLLDYSNYIYCDLRTAYKLYYRGIPTSSKVIRYSKKIIIYKNNLTPPPAK